MSVYGNPCAGCGGRCRLPGQALALDGRRAQFLVLDRARPAKGARLSRTGKALYPYSRPPRGSAVTGGSARTTRRMPEGESPRSAAR